MEIKENLEFMQILQKLPDKMRIKECIEFIQMLQKLPERKQWELYFITEGAILVAGKSI